MNILHITYALSHGGIGTMLVHIANYQCVNNNVSIIILSDIVAKDKLAALDKRVNVILLNRKTGSFSLNPIFRLNKILYRSNSNVFHFHSGEITKYLLPFIWNKIKGKSCATSHASTYSVKTIKKARLKKFNNLFSISQAVADDLFNIASLKSTLVYNGVNLKDFLQKPNLIKQEGSPFKLIQIGRMLHKIKGQDILIDALEKVNAMGFHNWELYFLGGVGDSQKFLEDKVRNLGLLDKIKFIPPKSHSYIEKYLCNYDLLVQPSRAEGFGLTIAEGMAAKIPVLVSDLPAPMEIINQGKYGNYFKTGDAEDCAKKILLIIQGKYENDMLEQAYQRVQDLHSVETTAQNYLNEYEKIIR